MTLHMVRVFISYAHADESLRQELDKHLASLKHQGIIETWHDRRIAAGQEWAVEIDENLRTSQVILLLASADFISSSYCYEKEMQEAMRQHESGEAVVIPIILRPCDWRDLPFGKLQAATRDGRPITKYPTLDDGFLEVAQSIKSAAARIGRTLSRGRSGHPQRAPARNATVLGVSGQTPRSGNLRVKKSFSDHERDTFRVKAFEYISTFFENSLSELANRNAHLKTHFRSRDANSFEAAVYENGKQSAQCGIWLSSGHYVGDIGYSNTGLGNASSYNESLNIADDGHVLGLKPLGLGSYSGDIDKEILTLEGAAEYLWSMFIRPLQER